MMTELLHLPELSITNCQILDKGDVAIENSFLHNASLEALSTAHNTIDEGGEQQQLLIPLAKNDTLKKLS